MLAKRAVNDYPNFSWEVDEEMQSLALQLPNPEDEPDEYARRKDLRDLEAYSVDPASARDFDQALSYTKHSDGTYTLWVHIADVSHYVTPGSLLDDNAKKRATSVYLPSRGLPMHPPALSTGLCALKEKVDRFALTCELSYTATGDKKDTPNIYLAVVNVKANLSYDYVDEKLAQNDPYWVGMLELGNLLRSKFIGLDIETKEARLSSTQGNQLGFKVEQASLSTSMNEIFMIRANEAIAEFLKKSELPSLYRSHPIPDTPDVEKFNDQMAALGIEYQLEIPQRPQSFLSNLDDKSDVVDNETSVLDMLKGGGKLTLMPGGFSAKKKKKDKVEEKKEEEDSSKERKKPILFGLAHLSEEETEKWMAPFKEVLNEVRNVEDKSDRMVMMLTTLGMFGRAYYTPDNIGHFGLGSRCYTHFTAPIRRYSDIIVHRVLKGILNGTATKEVPIYSEEDLDNLSEYITDQSYDAETLERRVVGAGLAMMTRREDWSDLVGTVTRISPRMVSVVIREVLDGRIRISDLSKQEVIVDPSESIAFVKRDEGSRLKKILNSSDWLEMLDEEDEPIEVLIRLGDKKAVKIVARDYIDGKVTVIPS
jgi:exoribonuclease R